MVAKVKLLWSGSEKGELSREQKYNIDWCIGGSNYGQKQDRRYNLDI
jgi:hypothetical protein